MNVPLHTTMGFVLECSSWDRDGVFRVGVCWKAGELPEHLDVLRRNLAILKDEERLKGLER